MKLEGFIDLLKNQAGKVLEKNEKQSLLKALTQALASHTHKVYKQEMLDEIIARIESKKTIEEAHFLCLQLYFEIMQQPNKSILVRLSKSITLLKDRVLEIFLKISQLTHSLLIFKKPSALMITHDKKQASVINFAKEILRKNSEFKENPDKLGARGVIYCIVKYDLMSCLNSLIQDASIELVTGFTVTDLIQLAIKYNSHACLKCILIQIKRAHCINEQQRILIYNSEKKFLIRSLEYESLECFHLLTDSDFRLRKTANHLISSHSKAVNF